LAWASRPQRGGRTGLVLRLNGGVPIPGEVVAVGGIIFMNGLAEILGTVDPTGDLDLRFIFSFDAFGIETVTERPGRVVAVFLKGVDLAGEAAKDGDGAGEFFGVGGELFAGLRLEEEFGKVSGGELKTDFGKVAGVVFAEVLNEVILEEPFLQGLVLLMAPLVVTAPGFPVGDVALGDADAVLAEGLDNFVVGNVIAKHAIDHVAFEVGKASDFAIASELARRRRN
jgi:hypothetical protein